MNDANSCMSDILFKTSLSWFNRKNTIITRQIVEIVLTWNAVKKMR